jgi:polyhydroxyalkanoate synthesis regulator phasin
MNVLYIYHILTFITFILSTNVDYFDEYNSSVYGKLIKEGKFKLDDSTRNIDKLYEDDEEIDKEFDRKYKKKIDKTEESIVAPEKIRERIMLKEQAIRLEREAI